MSPRRVPYYEAPGMPPKEQAQQKRNFQELEQTPVALFTSGSTNATTQSTSLSILVQTTVTIPGNSNVLVIGGTRVHLENDGASGQFFLETVFPDGSTEVQATDMSQSWDINVNSSGPASVAGFIILSVERIWKPTVKVGQHTFRLLGKRNSAASTTVKASDPYVTAWVL